MHPSELLFLSEGVFQYSDLSDLLSVYISLLYVTPEVSVLLNRKETNAKWPTSTIHKHQHLFAFLSQITINLG